MKINFLLNKIPINKINFCSKAASKNPCLVSYEPDVFISSKDNEIKQAQEKINKSDINPLIKDELSTLCTQSDYYSPCDYVDNFINLAHFTNEDGEQTFYNTNLIEEILEINPASVEASYMQSIIELVQEGAIEADAFSFVNKNLKLNDALIDDIEKLYDVVVNNKDKTKLKQELLEAYIPKFENETSALENSKIGDAFEISGEKNIRIKTSDDASQKMSISKETYNKLFPMFKRFSTIQSESFGDCYLIEPLMLLYQDNNERAHIVSMFRETEDHDIIVKLPNGIEETLFYKNEILPPEEIEDDGNYSTGADGYKLLEYAYARNEREKRIQAAKAVRKGKSLEKFEEFLSKNGENIFIDHDVKKRYKKFSTYLKQVGDNLDATFPQHLIANGGRSARVLETLGYDNVDYTALLLNNKVAGFVLTPDVDENITDEELYKELLKQSVIGIEDFSDIMTENNIFDSFNVLLALDNKHEYGLKRTFNEQGEEEYRLYNPHCQAFPIKVNNLKELLSHCVRIDFAQKTDYEN